jgi:spore germination protein
MILLDREGIIMIPSDDKISSIQVGVFVYNIILGIGILTLPASLTKEVKSDAWLICLVAGLTCIAFTYIVCKVGVKYPNYGFVGTLRFLFGKFLGTILAIPIFAYFVSFTAIVIRFFGETTKVFLLNVTPLEFIIFPLLILVVLLARSGVEPIARFFEAVTPVIIFIAFILLLVALPKSDFTNMMPILTHSFQEYFGGLRAAFFAFAGFEILLVLFPYMRKPKEAFKASAISIGSITIFYTLAVMLNIARFGVKETSSLIYPTMTLMKASEIPGAFIERMEGLLMALWVLFVFTTITALVYGFSVVGGDLLKHKRRKHIISMFIPIIYILSLVGESVAEQMSYSSILETYLGTYTIIVIPIIMFIASLIRGKGGKRNET